MSEKNTDMKYKKLIEDYLNLKLDINSYENDEAEKIISDFIVKLEN